MKPIEAAAMTASQGSVLEAFHPQICLGGAHLMRSSGRAL